MAKKNEENLFTARKSLGEICKVPDRIISVYSLEKHVWADSNSEPARRARKPELQTVKEFELNPVRPFLTDLLRGMAAPYKTERKENPIGQGYWIQAEFGSGKSHLLCLVSTLALGQKEAWDIIQEKESLAGRGKRESLHRFWEEGLEAKSAKGKKGIFVIVKTLVGAGGGAVGMASKGQRLSEYILDAAKEQLQLELGKNISLYPSELLADRFLREDLDRYRKDLGKFLKDPKYFDADEFEDVNDFIRDIQQNQSPKYKLSCGNKLWRFYDEYLKVQPQIPWEAEDILKNLIETILREGYTGVLLVLDEVSLFMKNRDENQRTDDEKTLVVLSNRLAKVHNLPIWTVCAAQQAIESKMGIKNILADDRLKIVKLLEEDKDYYDIVLARVRQIKDEALIGPYYLHYKRGFTWPAGMGETEFRHFFPFHKPALEVLRAITYELTTARSAIHFMHQTLKHQIKGGGNELIRLWELFDEAVRYEEDPSGVHAGLVAVKTRREADYRAYEACKRQIDGQTKGYLKVHRDKALKVIQTLFLYHIARTRQKGINPEEIANAVLIERDADATPEENIQHYESLTENLKKELPQVAQDFDEEKRPRYRFEPVFVDHDPRKEFQKARDLVESNQALLREAWEHLLALDEWLLKLRQVTMDLSGGVRSLFRDIAPYIAPWERPEHTKAGPQVLTVVWQGREISGRVDMRDLGRVVSDKELLPPLNTEETDHDFAVFIGTKPVPAQTIQKIIDQRKDPRVLFWTPADLTEEERGRLLDFAAYRKLVMDWQGKDTDEAVGVIDFAAARLQTELATIVMIVQNSYGRGRFDARDNSKMDFHVAGELNSVIAPLVGRVLTAAYESRDIKFEPPFVFRREEGVKVINGIVRTGTIPKGTKPNQNVSAAQNFGFGLRIMKKSAEKELDISDNAYVRDLWEFIDKHLPGEAQPMKMINLYKNFMGVGGPKDYGLTRRMVQIYLLCLAREGKIRIGVSPKSGLAAAFIDYSNMADIEFNTRIVDSLTEVQKMAKPENWEVLRPYAEKLLGEAIPSTHDDALITSYRVRLKKLFKTQREESSRLVSRARALFDTLKTQNPYGVEMQQISRLFAADLEGAEDINLALVALKEALGYGAYDTSEPSPADIDDLANRLKNFRDTERFLGFENEIRTAHLYCSTPLPEGKDFHDVRRAASQVAKKLAEIRPFVDSEVKLKTELVGKTPPDPGEKGTLGVLIHEYTTVYATAHDAVASAADEYRKVIDDILKGEEMKSLRVLEKITALQPAVSADLEQKLRGMADKIPVCPSPSRASIEEGLRLGPVHECGLTLVDASPAIERARAIAEGASAAFATAFNGKLEIFLNPTIRQRLDQGKAKAAIAALLSCAGVNELKDLLVGEVRSDPALVDLINRYLKRIVVKPVKLAEFSPSLRTLEKGQILTVAAELRAFLEKAFDDLPKDDDSLPMIRVE